MNRLAILCVLFIAAPLLAADDGFEPIFDGKTLDGWKTFDPSYWSMKDGAITAMITKARANAFRRSCISAATTSPLCRIGRTIYEGR